MKYFNLYYKENKINNYPLTEDELNNIFSSNKPIIKNDFITGESDNIPLDKIRIIKTIII
jgi:hypothetical protein